MPECEGCGAPLKGRARRYCGPPCLKEARRSRRHVVRVRHPCDLCGTPLPNATRRGCCAKMSFRQSTRLIQRQCTVGAEAQAAELASTVRAVPNDEHFSTERALLRESRWRRTGAALPTSASPMGFVLGARQFKSRLRTRIPASRTGDI